MGKFILNLFSPHPTPLPKIASLTLDFPKYSLKSNLFEILGLGDKVFFFFFFKEVDYKLDPSVASQGLSSMNLFWRGSFIF